MRDAPCFFNQEMTKTQKEKTKPSYELLHINVFYLQVEIL